jgi:hypothetical protein
MSDRLKTKEELPFKYFVVKTDDSPEFKEYKNWLLKNFGTSWDSNYKYIGYDNREFDNGLDGNDNLSDFKNNPKVFTAKEFMDILRANESRVLEPNTYARFTSTSKVEELFNKAKDNGLETFLSFKWGELLLIVGDTGRLFSASGLVANKREISPEEFEERLNNSIKAIKKEDNMEKVIIAYKAPMDLFCGQVKKGEVYVMGEMGMAHPERINCHYVPKEIVKTWEPVYEEVKPEYKVGDWVTIDINLVEKDRPKHVLVVENKYKLTQKLRTNSVPDYCGDVYDWDADCFLNSKWFRLATPEEIASAQEETVSMGGFEVVVKPTGIYHKNDNITKFCKGLYDFNNNLPKELGGYGLKFSDISFTRTGCQHNVTKLDAWVSVYTKYLQKQKS